MTDLVGKALDLQEEFLQALNSQGIAFDALTKFTSDLLLEIVESRSDIDVSSKVSEFKEIYETLYGEGVPEIFGEYPNESTSKLFA